MILMGRLLIQNGQKLLKVWLKTKMFGARFQDCIKEALSNLPKRYQPLQGNIKYSME